jgi:hypothetical protein
MAFFVGHDAGTEFIEENIKKFLQEHDNFNGYPLGSRARREYSEGFIAAFEPRLRWHILGQEPIR